jgi:tetratricopeptide (TPR) repeat protein
MRTTLTILLTLFINHCFANEDLFSQANEKYMIEDYQEASRLYEQILKNGLESSELYYNLGNCYYHIQDYANSIWYYEKSLLLNNNKQTRENLELSNLEIIDKIDTFPKIFYLKWWSDFVQLNSTCNWQMTAIICIWSTLIFVLITVFSSINLTKLIFASIFISSLFFSAATSSYNKNLESSAIIFSSIINVKSAPTQAGKKLFSLHSGTKVKIKDQIGEWLNIEISNGDKGWIQKESCKIII